MFNPRQATIIAPSRQISNSRQVDLVIFTDLKLRPKSTVVPTTQSARIIPITRVNLVVNKVVNQVAKKWLES
jgi:hypothetical protein